MRLMSGSPQVFWNVASHREEMCTGPSGATWQEQPSPHSACAACADGPLHIPLPSTVAPRVRSAHIVFGAQDGVREMRERRNRDARRQGAGLTARSRAVFLLVLQLESKCRHLGPESRLKRPTSTSLRAHSDPERVAPSTNPLPGRSQSHRGSRVLPPFHARCRCGGTQRLDSRVQRTIQKRRF